MLRPVSGRKESKVMLTEATSEGARGDIPSPYCSIDRLTRRCCTAACDCRHHLYDVCQMCLVRAKEARATRVGRQSASDGKTICFVTGAAGAIV